MLPARHDVGIMNETSNSNSSQAQAENQPGGAGNPGRGVLESLCSAVNEGAEQAKAAAENAIPKVKAALSEATYWLGFGATFASVFSYTVIKELAPEILKAGLRDGAQAGKRSGERWASRSRTQTEAAGAGAATGADLSGSATPSGAG